METLYCIALTRVFSYQPAPLLQLYRQLGSATAIMDHRHDIRSVVPDASPKLQEMLLTVDGELKRAEEELTFDQQHAITPLCFNDEGYPQRLRECEDAPLVLYYRGNADLNSQRVICMVGTRHATIYGQDFVRRFLADLHLLCPNVLVVSGLAYGVDIQAHRNALHNGLPTVAVLAHGLDDLYPPRHRETAIQMLTQGGLLTEFTTHTNADKVNFVRRNRIVAGMSDACIVVESAAKGGSLITAELARSYNREVFAVPGRVGDNFSEGCNNLIRDNAATLLGSADDFVRLMGWQTDAALQQAQQQGIERNMFPALSPDEESIVAFLRHEGDLQINTLSVSTGIPIGRMASLLFQLEMKGVVKTLAGGFYHLLQ
ncbi:MAG: DNA-processing protein DprA [Prevotella sp.]|nr:DNA-processing protein DprA [Prevotella sp.]